MKKFIMLLFVLTLCIGNAGCSKDKKSVSLYERGNELIETVILKAETDEWSEIMSDSDEIREIGEEIADGDYDEAQSVYEIKIDAEKTDFFKNNNKYRKLPDELKEEMSARMISSFTTTFNGKYGSNVLAASSVYNASKTFVDKSVKENVMYLYLYEDGYPFVVTFWKCDDGAVSASCTFLFEKDIDEDDFADDIGGGNSLQINKIK